MRQPRCLLPEQASGGPDTGLQSLTWLRHKPAGMVLTVLKSGQVLYAIVANRRCFCNPPVNFFYKIHVLLTTGAVGTKGPASLAWPACRRCRRKTTRRVAPVLIIGKSSPINAAATPLCTDPSGSEIPSAWYNFRPVSISGRKTVSGGKFHAVGCRMRRRPISLFRQIRHASYRKQFPFQ